MQGSLAWALALSYFGPPPLVDISWSFTKIKVLGVFIAHGDLSKENWRPHLEAVARCLNSWHSRALSFTGKALVINAMALSRVCYVTSLVHMPPWVRAELNQLVFKFFWPGKRDLVSRKVMAHPKREGGFSVVSIEFKVVALLAQWVWRLVVCPSGWVFLLTYWLLDRHGVTSYAFFYDAASFPASPFPPFYSTLFSAWKVRAVVAPWPGLPLVPRLGVAVPSTPSPVGPFILSCSRFILLHLTVSPSSSLLSAPSTGLPPGVLCSSSRLTTEYRTSTG